MGIMGPRVLLIDDLADSLALLSRMISRHLPTAEILTAQSGAEGISVAQSESPDVILLDARMPEMDGFETCRRLKSGSQTARIPVLMVSGVLVDTVDRVTGLETGADGYICKPFETEELVAQIKALVRVKRAEDELRRRERNLEGELSARTRNLIDSEQRFRILFERSPDAIFVEDTNAVVLDVNPAACQMHEMTREQLVGKHATELVPPDCRDQIVQEFPKWLSGELRHVSSRRVTQSGRVIHTDVRANRITYDGRPAVLLHVRDVTASREAERALQVSEARFRAIVEDQTEFVTRWKPDGTHTFVNESACRFLRRTREELVGWNFLPLYPPDEAAAFMKKVQGITPQNPIMLNEAVIRFADGSARSAMWSNRGIFDADGKLIEVQSVGRDVTDQRAAERALRDSEARYRALVESQNDLIVRLAPDGRILFANKAYCAFVGRSEQSLIGQSFLQFLPEGERHRALERLLSLAPSAPVQRVEHLVMSAAGRSAWLEWINRGLFDERGVLSEIQADGRDVTDQRESQDRQNATSLWLRAVVDIADELLGCVDLDSLYRRAVELARERLGLERAGIMLEHEGLVHGLYGTNMKGETTDERANRQTLNEEWRERFRFKDVVEQRWMITNEVLREWDGHQMRATGRVGDIAVTPVQTASRLLGVFFNDNAITMTPLSEGRQEVVAVYCSLLANIAERKASEVERLQLAAAVEQSTEMIMITDRQGVVRYVNPGFTKITGYTREEVEGRTPNILKSGHHDPIFFKQMWETVQSDRVWAGRIVNRRKDGSVFETETTISPVRDASGRVVSFLALSLDVSRTVQMEAELRQAQKMESVGRLAGGIAHDFNNLLTAILGFAQILQSELESHPTAKADVEEIIRAGERAAKLTKQLLALGRRQIIEMRAFDLNPVVANLDRLLRRLVGEDVNMVTRYSEEECGIKADAGLLEQVMMNLVINARDAMPNGGTLTISTAVQTLADGDRDLPVSSKPGVYVLLAVKDTGIGMSEHVIEHAFDPFFTTKTDDKGSGLGLPTVYGIVTQCRGFIELDSTVGVGTEVRVYFPRVAILDHSKALSAAEQLPRGSETILVTEDEVLVRRLTRRNLESLGYRVLEAADGEEALKIYQSAQEPIHLVVTDVIMPVMGGPELVDQLTQLQANLKVIYLSGFAEDVVLERLKQKSSTTLLQKPYTLETLAQTIRKMLDSA